MTARLHAPAAALLPTPSLALAHQRIAELRAAAERDQLVRLARTEHTTGRTPAVWPARLAAALRDSIASALPARADRLERRSQPCPTC